MGLYNLARETDGRAPLILALLGLRVASLGRYRDAYVQDGHYVIHTRNGGGNRPHYGRYLVHTNHPLYVDNRDDEYDPTYADIRFRFAVAGAYALSAEFLNLVHARSVGEGWRVVRRLNASRSKPPSRERWEAVFASMREGGMPAMEGYDR